MKTFSETRRIILMAFVLMSLAGLSIVYLSSCNQSKFSQPISPTSAITNSDSSGVVIGKGKGVGRKDSVSSLVKPNVPQPGSCPGYKEGSQYVANYYQFTGVYLPEDTHKGKYLMLVGGQDFVNMGGYDLGTLHDKYCFRRAVIGASEVATYIYKGFIKTQLLISIGSHNDGVYNMVSNWQDIVNDPQYNNGQVLGFWMDEPSGLIKGASMYNIDSIIHAAGGKLWLEDYDTGPIPSVPYFAAHNYHLADVPMLDNADYVSCNGNTSIWVNGCMGTGTYLTDDYNEFQYWFGNRFNTLECQPTDPSGALRNDATMYNWLTSYSSVNNFALYIGNNITFVSGDLIPYVDNSNVTARENALANFMNDANYAGFLGHQYQIYYYTYACQTSCVNFVPPSGVSSGAGSPVYYGVWTNNTYYMSPVSASTPNAVACWILQTTAPTSQTVDVY